MIGEIWDTCIGGDGRICRRTYWLRGIIPMLVISAVYMAIYVGILLLVGNLFGPLSEGNAEALAVVLYLPLGIFLLASHIYLFKKRLHDFNRSGWWSLGLFIPIVNILIYIPWIIALGAIPSNAGANRFGNVPD